MADAGAARGNARRLALEIPTHAPCVSPDTAATLTSASRRVGRYGGNGSMVEVTAAELSGRPGRTKTCFAATPIGEAGTDIRERSDTVLDYVIIPALGPMGYTITRADKITEAGSITSQVITHLVTSDLAILDLSGHNPNVFYELGIRHAANKPYVQIDDGNARIPFDVTVFRTIVFDYRSVRSIGHAKLQLEEMVRGYEQGSLVESPVTNAPDVQPLLSAGDPVKDQLASIENVVMQMHGNLLGVQFERTTNIMDVGVLQRFIGFYADRGVLSIESRTALEQTLQSPHLKEWARGLPVGSAAPVTTDATTSEPPG